MTKNDVVFHANTRCKDFGAKDCTLISCLPGRWEYTESAASRHLSRQSDDRKDEMLKVNKRRVQQRKFNPMWLEKIYLKLVHSREFSRLWA